MNSALTALERLKEGNRRYVSDSPGENLGFQSARRSALVEGQAPFAVILGCSDSRVPAEMVFDQGLGDLFVIRVAGNIVAPSQVGSVEFAAHQFGIPLVVVMGHSDCGAIGATVDALQHQNEGVSPNITAIVERIRPSIEPLMNDFDPSKKSQLIDQAVRANVRASVNQLSHGSKLLETMILENRLRVVGAEYCLESGVVDFFDELTNTKLNHVAK